MNEQHKQYIREFFKGTGLYGIPLERVTVYDLDGVTYAMLINNEQEGTTLSFSDNWTPPTIQPDKQCIRCGEYTDTLVTLPTKHVVCHDCYNEIERQGTLQHYGNGLTSTDEEHFSQFKSILQTCQDCLIQDSSVQLRNDAVVRCSRCERRSMDRLDRTNERLD